MYGVFVCLEKWDGDNLGHPPSTSRAANSTLIHPSHKLINQPTINRPTNQSSYVLPSCSQLWCSSSPILQQRDRNSTRQPGPLCPSRVAVCAVGGGDSLLGRLKDVEVQGTSSPTLEGSKLKSLTSNFIGTNYHYKSSGNI